MAFPILSTKLFIPPPRADQLSRPQLLQKLDQGAGFPLTLVSASAGSGKTTLLSEWAARTASPTAWLTLDSGDNEPVAFLSYLIAALQTTHPALGGEALDLLQNAPAARLELVLVHLLNEASQFSEDHALILDDYHLVTHPAAHQLTAFLVEHLPPQLHLIIASRVDPPLPLARYRARNRLYEIRGQDLQFTEEETAGFLQRGMGLTLDSQEIHALAERTEGWIAGLQLAALSMRGRADQHPFIRAFTGSRGYIAEYLLEEILHQQPENVQSFLLRTAVLERMNADLCAVVSGCANAPEMLNQIHRANMFVVALDHQGEWFRYHHLFADLLRARLRQTFSPEQIDALHQRASAWFARHEFIPEAVEHALAARDYHLAAQWIEPAARGLIFSGRINRLRGWLDALHQSVFERHPQLVFFQFWIDILQSRADLSDASLETMDALLASLPAAPENDRLRGEILAVECRALVFTGRTDRAIRAAEEALRLLPETDQASRARVHSALSIVHELQGRHAEATTAYDRCRSLALASGDLRLAAHSEMIRGLNLCHYGQLHAAADAFREIIALGDQPAPASSAQRKPRFYPAGQGHIGLAGILLEWNQLEEAEKHLQQGLDLCRAAGLDGIFIGQLLLARLRQAQGDLEGAEEALSFPQQAFPRVDAFTLTHRQILLDLARGDPDSARHRAQPLFAMIESGEAASMLPLIFFEILQTAAAQICLAMGDIDKTLFLLNQVESGAEAGARHERLLEIYLLRARAIEKQHGASASALEPLRAALQIGASNGYVLRFLEAGAEIVPLLHAALLPASFLTSTQKTFTRTLLHAFSEAGLDLPPDDSAANQRLIEPLTPREREVLALLAAGNTNAEIADQLFITVRTVKKHTSNIYGKLNASTRTQAVAIARELGLLDQLSS
ncbi:MAG: hypothetical protein JW750_07470 [Anaerolineaceae bacterium]|nr:hypothetical protein [Anaerolineaceae bacterium]